MPIVAIYGPVNDQCLLRSGGFHAHSLEHNVKFLFGDLKLSINKGQRYVRLDSVNISQPPQTHSTAPCALCKTSRTTLSTLSLERFSSLEDNVAALTITPSGQTCSQKRQHNQSDHEFSVIARLGDPATTGINSVSIFQTGARTGTHANVGKTLGETGERDGGTAAPRDNRLKKVGRDRQLP